MIIYRSYYILQRTSGFLILDNTKCIVTTEQTLSECKRFIDLVIDGSPSIEAVNEFVTD